MQCWQSGEPQACRTEAIPPQPMHRGAEAVVAPTVIAGPPPWADVDIVPDEGAGVVSGEKYFSPSSSATSSAPGPVGGAAVRNSGEYAPRSREGRGACAVAPDSSTMRIRRAL